MAAALSLLKGDRLEPHPGMHNVEDFDLITVFPARVLFWRKSSETRARRRNPLIMSPELGLTVDTLMVDMLHTMNLGPAQFWCAHVIWRLISVDAYKTGASGDQLHHLSVLQIRHRLFEWYREQRRLNPERVMTQLADLTVQMIGKAKKPVLTTKAAETKWFVPFLVEELRQKGAAFAAGEVARDISAGEALVEIWELTEAAPFEVPRSTVRRLFDAAKRHVVLAAEAGIAMKPKHHMLLHMVARAETCGNPDRYSTFEDESINRLLKKVGEAAHRSVWEARVLVTFDKVEASRGSKRKAVE